MEEWDFYEPVKLRPPKGADMDARFIDLFERFVKSQEQIAEAILLREKREYEQQAVECFSEAAGRVVEKTKGPEVS